MANSTTKQPEATSKTAQSLVMSEIELFNLGIEQVAYIKPVLVNGAKGFAVHNAQGEAMTVAANKDLALNAIRNQDLYPISLH